MKSARIQYDRNRSIKSGLLVPVRSRGRECGVRGAAEGAGGAQGATGGVRAPHGVALVGGKVTTR